MKYRATKISNVEEFLLHGVNTPGDHDKWKVFYISPTISGPSQARPQNIEVLQWLVVLQSED